MSDRIHRFKVDEIVEILPSTLRSAAIGNYAITRLLPCDANDPQYCIKSQDEKHERILPERDLLGIVSVLT
ncbi:MAG: hypothetical protein ABUL48_05105 [Pseudorhodoplanes sp.]